MQAYRVLGYISVGLADGRILQLRSADYVPPSVVASSAYQVADWLASGNVEIVTDASAARLAQADAAAAPQANPVRGSRVRGSSTIDGYCIPVNERQSNPNGGGPPPGP